MYKRNFLSYSWITYMNDIKAALFMVKLVGKRNVNMLLYPHQPTGASVELQYADELRSRLCMNNITCGAWKSVLGNDGNSPRFNGLAQQHCNCLFASNWIQFLSYACLVWQPRPATLKAVSFLHWHACNVVWNPWRTWRVREEEGDIHALSERNTCLYLSPHMRV